MTQMQKLCENGHYYNPVRGECPHCKNQRPPNLTYPKTKGLSDPPSNTVPVGTGMGATVFYPEGPDFNPVVGWLVCIEGKERGRDFRLHAGQNFIGRNIERDVYLSDETVSYKEPHTIIISDPINNKFYVRPGQGSGNTYLNGDLVMEARSLKGYDIIGVGTVVHLLFLPLCGEQFQWKINATAAS